MVAQGNVRSTYDFTGSDYTPEKRVRRDPTKISK